MKIGEKIEHSIPATKVGEDTRITLDLKTIGLIIGFVLSLSSMYFVLKSDIAKAMEEPEPEITRIEFSYKDELIRTTVEGVQADMNSIKEDVIEIKEHLNRMDERLYEISKK
tara:strand:+ start:23254 stop:23589 length:336 start_codon:yes stop_codon:yes gene_type:complete